MNLNDARNLAEDARATAAAAHFARVRRDRVLRTLAASYSIRELAAATGLAVGTVHAATKRPGEPPTSTRD